MAAAAKKFGAFGGVFTPSVLTILGVIMYLRLPKVVGEAGLYAAIGIVLVSHVVSITTGLSISSIATDKRVGAGGPYYVLSRSLGLPLGGTIGLALFVGLSFSISLYVIGFSESFLAYIAPHVDAVDLSTAEKRLFWIRVCGSATVLLLTIITFISTSLAIKAQYFVLVAIILSIVSIALGDTEAPLEVHLEPPASGESLAVLFGIFFPAVTGFTAGVNMSGDLKDPKRAIPIGTIAAISTGLLVYLGLTIYLAYRVPVSALRSDGELFLHVAKWEVLVVLGIWGATLSSALGSILGAPRILQSMSGDRVTPRFFAKGTGLTNEPRRALILACLVGEAGVLIGELDAIARVVSMVFLALYGFINLSCAIESYVSPDFRPSFRIPKWIGVVGAVTCLVLMLELDPLAMGGAMVVMLLLFGYLSRRRLTLDSGDAWEGVWSSLVRTGLRRLATVGTQLRNWKPNILAFSQVSGERSPALTDLVVALIGNVGVATDVRIHSDDPDGRAEGGASPGRGSGAVPEGASEDDSEEPPPGLFVEHVFADAPHPTIAAMARHAGLGGVRPNTVMIPWSFARGDGEGFARLAAELGDTDHGLLVHRAGTQLDASAPIDIWWYDELGNLPFAVTMARLLSRSDTWRRHPMRVFLLTTDPASDDLLAVEAREYVSQARLVADVQVRHVPATALRFQDVIEEESRGSALVLVPMPDALDARTLSAYAGLESIEGHVIAFRPQSLFERSLRGSHGAGSIPPPSMAGADAEGDAPVELRLPDHPALAELVTAFDARVRASMNRFFEGAASRFYDTELTTSLIASLHVPRVSLGDAAEDGDAHDARLEAVADWLREAKSLLAESSERLGEVQRVALELAAEVLDPSGLVEHRASVVVARRREELEPLPEDSPELRRVKRRKRGGMFSRGPVKFRLPMDVLERWGHEEFVRAAILPALGAALAHHHQALLETGRTLSRFGRTLATIESEELAGTIESARDEFEQLRSDLRARRSRAQTVAFRDARRVTTEFSETLDRLDVEEVARSRKIPRKRQVTIAAFDAPLADWSKRAGLLSERAALGAELASVTHEIRTAASRLQRSLEQDVVGDMFAASERLQESLERVASEGASIEQFGVGALRASWDPRADLDELSVSITDATDELPERLTTCTDEALLHLGRSGELEEVETLLRRGVEVAARRELLSRVEEATTHAHAVSDETRTTLEELSHMIAFQQRVDREADNDALQSSIERARAVVEERLNALTDARDRLRRANREGMAALASVANAYDLESLRTAASGRMQKSIGRAKSTEGGGLRDGLHRLMGGLLYRRSHGLLVAMKMRSVSQRAAAQSELRDLVRAATPDPSVVEALPSFYQQLFLGRGAPGGPFRVPRAADQVAVPDRGLVLVVGDPGSGKTSTVQQLAAALSPPALVWVPSPEGGSVSVAEFERALSHDSRWGSSQELFPRLVDGSLVVIDDLELWWERREGGLDVIDRLLELVEQHGRRLRFIVSVNEHAFELLDRITALSASASSVLSCDPFSAEELRHATLRRHRSTGFTFQLGEDAETSLGEWDLARLFSAHFDATGGNIAGALRGWLAYIEQVREDGGLSIRRPSTLDWGALDALDGDAKTLLLQLVIHKEASPERLRRVMGRPARVVDGMVRSLRAAGLVVSHPSRGATLNPFLRHRVVAHFRSRGLL